MNSEIETGNQDVITQLLQNIVKQKQKLKEMKKKSYETNKIVQCSFVFFAFMILFLYQDQKNIMLQQQNFTNYINLNNFTNITETINIMIKEINDLKSNNIRLNDYSYLKDRSSEELLNIICKLIIKNKFTYFPEYWICQYVLESKTENLDY